MRHLGYERTQPARTFSHLGIILSGKTWAGASGPTAKRMRHRLDPCLLPPFEWAFINDELKGIGLAPWSAAWETSKKMSVLGRLSISVPDGDQTADMPAGWHDLALLPALGANHRCCSIENAACARYNLGANDTPAQNASQNVARWMPLLPRNR